MISMLRSFWQEEDGAPGVRADRRAHRAGLHRRGHGLGGELDRVFNAIVTIPGG
jgi:hypothetical protein